MLAAAAGAGVDALELDELDEPDAFDELSEELDDFSEDDLSEALSELEADSDLALDELLVDSRLSVR